MERKKPWIPAPPPLLLAASLALLLWSLLWWLGQHLLTMLRPLLLAAGLVL